MRRSLGAWTAAAALALAWPTIAQAPAPRPGFGPPAASEVLAAAPQTPGAEGDQQRHYLFKEGGREMPYRLYVPKSYDPKKPMPLVVALHGFGGNQDYFFARVADLGALCDQYGFIFVAPMGYSTDGWYGAPLNIPGDVPRSSGAPKPPPARSAEEETKLRALSEQDVMNVLALVRKEYKVDASRIYLMGHSMGGMGTYVLGRRHADIWAAIAPMSGAMGGVDYDFPKLKRVPVLLSAGSTETQTAANARAQVVEMRALGMKADYAEVEGGTHMSMIAPTVPKIFAFFAGQRKAAQRSAELDWQRDEAED